MVTHPTAKRSKLKLQKRSQRSSTKLDEAVIVPPHDTPMSGHPIVSDALLNHHDPWAVMEAVLEAENVAAANKEVLAVMETHSSAKSKKVQEK